MVAPQAPAIGRGIGKGHTSSVGLTGQTVLSGPDTIGPNPPLNGGASDGRYGTIMRRSASHRLDSGDYCRLRVDQSDYHQHSEQDSCRRYLPLDRGKEFLVSSGTQMYITMFMNVD